MKFYERFDNVLTGVLSGLVLPLLTGLIIYAFTSNHQSLHSYVARIADSSIVTHAITLCVFPNILIFLIFNRLDMLLATRGVLAVTISWAIIVFGVKIL
jgi:hypothetical protein